MNKRKIKKSIIAITMAFVLCICALPGFTLRAENMEGSDVNQTAGQAGVGIVTPTDAEKEMPEQEAVPQEETTAELEEVEDVAIKNINIFYDNTTYNKNESVTIKDNSIFKLSFLASGATNINGREVTIDIPKGLKLVPLSDVLPAAPGIKGVSGNTVVAAEYTPVQQQQLEPNPTWVGDGSVVLDSNYTINYQSGTITYKLKDGVSDIEIVLGLQAEDRVYDFTGNHVLSDISVSMKGTKLDTTVSEDKNVISVSLGDTAEDAKGYITTAVGGSKPFIDDVVDAYMGQEFTVTAGASESFPFGDSNDIYYISFDYVYPTGADISLITSGWILDGTPVDNLNGTTTQKITCDKGSVRIPGFTRVDSGKLCQMTLVYPKDSVFFVDDVLKCTMKNLTWKTACLDEEGNVSYMTHTMVNEPSITATIIEEPEFVPNYIPLESSGKDISLNWEAINGYDGVLKYLTRGVMNFENCGGSNGRPVRFRFDADERDNVSSVYIPVGTTDNTNLTKIVIKYKDEAEETVWNKGSGGMPGTISYVSSGEFIGTTWKFTAAEEKYIEYAFVEYSEVTETEAASTVYGRCYAIGRPVLDSYTGIFSHNVFSAWQDDGSGNFVLASDSNIEDEDADNYQSTSEHGGFRWQKPADFVMNTVGKNESSVQDFAAFGRPGTPGERPMASYTFTNGTGSQIMNPVRVDFSLNENENKDNVTQINFPYSYNSDASEGAKQVKSITWTYEGDSTVYTWDSTSDTPYPFTPGVTGGTLNAPEGKTFGSVSVMLNGWNASTQVVSASVVGKPVDDDRFSETNRSKHTITITSVEGETEIASVSAGFVYKEMTKQYINPTGGSINLNAGEAGSLKVCLTPGDNKDNAETGTGTNLTNWYTHVTFALILPEGVVPSSENAIVNWTALNNNATNYLKYETTTASLVSSHEASEAERATADLGNVSARVYLYEFDDQDISFIRYLGGHYTHATLSIPFLVDPLCETYMLTYGQIFYASSNYEPVLTGPTGTVGTYTDGDKTLVSSKNRIEEATITGIGENEQMVRGDGATLIINKNPALIVQEHIADSEDGYKVYNSEDESSIAQFSKEEAGDIKLDIFNTVVDESVAIKDGYVFVPIPKLVSNSDQVGSNEFEFKLNGEPTLVAGETNLNEYEVRYITGTTSITATNGAAEFNSASKTYNKDANMVVIRLNNLIAGKGVEVHVPIIAPSVTSNDVQFDKFDCRSVFVLEKTSWATYNSGAKAGYLAATYYYPGWTLIFDSQGGSNVDLQTIEDGDKFMKPVDPVYPGHTFEGWYTDEDCTDGNIYDFSSEVNSDLKLYAKWSTNLYTVSFVNDGPYADYVNMSDGDDQSVMYEGYPEDDCTLVSKDSGYEVIGWKYSYITEEGQKVSGTVNGSTGYKDVQVLGDIVFHAVVFKMPKVTAVATNGYVSLAKTVDEASTPIATTDKLTGLTYESLPVTTALKFAPKNENYSLSSITIKDFQNPEKTYTWTGEDLVSGNVIFNTIDKDGKLVTVTLTLNIANNTLVANQHIGTDIEFSVVYGLIDTKYKLQHYVMKTDGTYSDTPTDEDTIENVKSGSTITPVTKTYTGAVYDSSATLYGDSKTEFSTTATTVKEDGSTVVKLYYVRNAHEVIFDVNGIGTAPDSLIDVYYGALVAKPADPTAPGYSFSGWYTDKNTSDGNQWNFTTGKMPDEDLTLYAKWEENANVNITYESKNTNFGTVNSALESVAPATGVAIGSTATAKPGYVFVKWVDEDGNTVATTPKYVPAKKNGLYEAAKYIAVFDAAENTQYIVKYYVISLDGLTYTQVGKSITKTGKTGTEASYDITNFDGMVYDNTKYKDSENEESLDALNIAPDGSLVINVYYNREVYPLVYDENGHGVAPAGENKKFGDTITKPEDLSAEGYIFDGWYTDADCTNGNQWNFGTGTMPAKELTLYAKWTMVHNYTITFDGNGAISGEMDDQKFGYDEKKPLTDNEFVKDGYTFMGWATTPGGGVVYKDGQEVSKLVEQADGNIVLYAVWIKNTTTDSGTDKDNTATKTDGSSTDKNTTTTDKKPDGVHTGDSMNLGLVILMMLCAGVVAFVISRKKRAIK